MYCCVCQYYRNNTSFFWGKEQICFSIASWANIITPEQIVFLSSKLVSTDIYQNFDNNLLTVVLLFKKCAHVLKRVTSLYSELFKQIETWRYWIVKIIPITDLIGPWYGPVVIEDDKTLWTSQIRKKVLWVTNWIQSRQLGSDSHTLTITIFVPMIIEK